MDKPHTHTHTHTQVFVDRTPLLKAGEYSIIIFTTIVFGTVTAVMYLTHHLKIVPHNCHHHHKSKE